MLYPGVYCQYLCECSHSLLIQYGHKQRRHIHLEYISLLRWIHVQKSLRFTALLTVWVTPKYNNECNRWRQIIRQLISYSDWLCKVMKGICPWMMYCCFRFSGTKQIYLKFFCFSFFLVIFCQNSTVMRPLMLLIWCIFSIIILSR